MGSRKRQKSKLQSKSPRARQSLWKRLVAILGIPVFMLLVGCITFSLVAFGPLSDVPSLLAALLTDTPVPGETLPPTDTLPPISPSASPSAEGTVDGSTAEAPADTLTPGSTPGVTMSPTSTQTPTDTPTPLPTPDDVMRERHIPILMYHYVSVPPSGSDVYRVDLSTPPDMFYRQMRWLKENGYNVITLEHLFYYLNTGWPELPAKPIVLTFDDGYVDNYTHAFPVLEKFGYGGTFFVLTDVTDRRQAGYMTWEMLQEMRAAGMDVQVHGREHLEMSDRDNDWLVFHLLGPAQTMAANLGYQPRFLAYPSGKYDAETVAVAQEMGYWGAVTTTQGSLQSKGAPFEMRRLRVRGSWDLAAFAGIVQEFSE